MMQYSFGVAGAFYHADAIDKAFKRNHHYNDEPLTKRQYAFYPYDGIAKLMLEPENPHNNHAVRVLVENHHVGYVPDDCVDDVFGAITDNRLIGATLKMYGGNYRDPDGTRIVNEIPKMVVTVSINEPRAKNRKLVLFLICLFGGVLGIHWFYLGSIKRGLLYLFTGGLLGIGWFIDLIKIATGGIQ